MPASQRPVPHSQNAPSSPPAPKADEPSFVAELNAEVQLPEGLNVYVPLLPPAPPAPPPASPALLPGIYTQARRQAAGLWTCLPPSVIAEQCMSSGSRFGLQEPGGVQIGFLSQAGPLVFSRALTHVRCIALRRRIK